MSCPVGLREVGSLLAGLFLGCAPEPLKLELPIQATDRAVVVLAARLDVAGEATLLTAAASDVDPTKQVIDPSALTEVPALTREQALQVALLHYTQPLMELPLEPGPLALSQGQPLLLGPPAAVKLEQAQVGFDTHSVRWEQVAALPSWAEGLRILEPCLDLAASPIDLGTSYDVTFLQPVAELLIAGMNDGGLIGIAPGSPLIRTDEADIGTALLTAVPSADGAFWLSNQAGAIIRATLGSHGTDNEREITRAPSQGELAWMDGAFFRAEAQEIFTLSTAGIGEHYLHPNWRELFRHAPATLAGVVRLGPEEALFVDGGPEATHFFHGELRSVRVPEAGGDLTALEQIPGLGVLVGTSSGRVFRQVESGWELLGDIGVEGSIASIVPFHRGFAVGTTRGDVIEWVRGRGFCAKVRVADAQLTRGALHRSTLYFGGPRSPAQPTAVVFAVAPPT